MDYLDQLKSLLEHSYLLGVEGFVYVDEADPDRATYIGVAYDTSEGPNPAYHLYVDWAGSAEKAMQAVDEVYEEKEMDRIQAKVKEIYTDLREAGAYKITPEEEEDLQTQAWEQVTEGITSLGLELPAIDAAELFEKYISGKVAIEIEE